MLPGDGDTVTVAALSSTWHAVDTTEYNVNLYHFAYALGKPTSNVLFWAVTVVNRPREIADVRLAIGSNAASVWWVNGKEVIGSLQRSADRDRRWGLQAPHAAQGSHIVRAAIVNAGGATDFCARFLDEAYRPIKDLTVTLGESVEWLPQSIHIPSTIYFHLEAAPYAKRMRERRWRIHRWWSSAPCQSKMSEKDVVALLTSGVMTRNRLPSAATPQSVAMPGAWNNVVGEPTDSTG